MQWIQARNRCLSFLTGSADGILCFNSPVCLAERRWFAGLPRCRGNFAPAVLMDILKFRSQLLNTSEQLTLHLRLVQNTLTRWGRTVAEKPRSLRQALRARENYLQTLLASSRDAIVVTNVERRVVAANPKALDLFGVSETNMEKFTIDVFLLHGQSLYFTGHGSRPMRREKRHGECKIRRLDGSLR